MSAIFSFSSLITVLLFIICTCTYLRELRPTIFDPSMPSPPDNNNQQQQQQQQMPMKHDGFLGFCWKLSRIGERLSPYIGGACMAMAFHVLFIQWWGLILFDFVVGLRWSVAGCYGLGGGWNALDWKRGGYRVKMSFWSIWKGSDHER